MEAEEIEILASEFTNLPQSLENFILYLEYSYYIYNLLNVTLFLRVYIKKK